jgi:hypothetical protein
MVPAAAFRRRWAIQEPADVPGSLLVEVRIVPRGARVSRQGAREAGEVRIVSLVPKRGG